MNGNQVNSRSPRFARWLLESLCSYDYLSTALWDLEELFECNVETKGVVKAKLLYYKEALSIIYHLYFKGQSQYSFNTIAILKNNIIIALRNFKKDKNHTFLNVVGLSSGLMIFLMIISYASYEFSFDNHHEKADQIYRVYKRVNTVEELYFDSGTPAPLANSMVTEFPEVEAAARFGKYRNRLLVANNQSFVEPAVYAVDPSVFRIFSLELLHGSPGELLKHGPNIAISESIAIKYFGRADVVDETMYYGGEIPLMITGVYEDMPPNSHFTMDIVANFDWVETAFEANLSNWNNNPYTTYVLLNDGTDAAQLEAKLTILREKYANDPMDEDGQSSTYFLQPLSEVHFADHIHWGLGDVADANRLYVFIAIAFVVLLMAGINYINLTTAKAIARVKETGIRKIVGANRFNLLSQFLIESGLLVFFSLALAVLFAYFALPAFSYFVDRPLVFDFMDSMFWVRLGLLGLVITVFSGFYPAFFMSSFKPLNAITKRGSFQHKGLLRNGLVIVQFALSAILIVSALVLQKQLHYIDSVDTGYTREQVMILSTRDDAVDGRLSIYMEEISKVPGVDAVATSWSLPTNITSNTQANWNGIEETQRVQMYMLGVTHGFFDLYEIEMAEGRVFDPEIASDESAVILNEAAVRAFGWQDPLQREMILQNGVNAKVIGVVKDFHIKSLKEKIEPLQIVLNPKYATLAVRISGDVSNVMLNIEKVYESFEPSYPFEYRYFEDIYNRAYVEDTKTGQITMVFSLLAVLIACLGLYGLASHKVSLQIKELGVRKVMGASSFSIARLLCLDFLLLIGIAFLVAVPAAYLILQSWLSSYAYHVELNAEPFVQTFMLLLLFAGVAVGQRTVKASLSNPVHALRDE